MKIATRLYQVDEENRCDECLWGKLQSTLISKKNALGITNYGRLALSADMIELFTVLAENR